MMRSLRRLGVEIMDQIQAFNAAHVNPYCEGTGGRFLLHAQVGIAEDIDITPGTRIPIGEEPEELIDQLKVLEHFHRYFTSGTGDIFPIDMTVHRNPEYVLDIIKGAFKMDLALSVLLFQRQRCDPSDRLSGKTL